MSCLPQHARRVVFTGTLLSWAAAGVPAAEPVALKNVKTERVVFHKVGDLELYMDLFLPGDVSAGQKRPAVVWFHGGGWRGGSPKQFAPQSQYLASQGLVCASVRYRLSGEAKFPACLNDCKCAVRFVRANAVKYGVDPNRIAVGGGSAGGHLAAMVGLTPDKFEGDGPNANASSRANLLLLFNPALDLRAYGRSNMVRDLLGTKTPTQPQLTEISPIVYVSDKAPPALVLHGDRDRTVPYKQAVAFCEALRKKGVSTELFTAEGKGHGWFNRGQDFLITLEQCVRFLKANRFWPQ